MGFQVLLESCGVDTIITITKENNITWDIIKPELLGSITTHYENKEELLDLLRIKSTKSDESVSLQDYVDRIQPEQKSIYYLVGENETALRQSPLLEMYNKKDIEVLLMDEPFGALDIMTKEKLQEELHKLWVNNPKTIIFITHDVEEAVFLGNRVILMTPRPGKIDLIIEPKLKVNRDMSIKTDSTFFDNVTKIRTRLKEN